MYNPSKRHALLFYLMLALSLLSPLSYAINLSSSSDEPIKIQADRAELDDIAGKSTYTGNVIITQGKSRLEAAKVILVSDSNGIKSFFASGEPAHLVQYDPETDVVTQAYAREIRYERDENRVTLKQNARLEQPSSSFQGEEIIYDTVKRLVTAESASSGEDTGRVEIIYQPPKANPQ
ncbi:lipopolysaccharide transport periplasmic protein LptA [Hahella sp. CCB-MM4]|uniref:lipopolysaccharide transport periplasmic protein LptA n=1 Tax=Hahella sp. (strain CCB-MM4) TaxID=1926491 RepID=UPI000B9B4C5B|nr:lipopolysaccharide transport periplasmic protein LptA [Hahella sp. CCB-MM4]OZG70541.1 lipopolysaccharide transport periplasmic protein LptA [Hahella sp. CCB-MM4]